jgi:hypothetical protein
MAKGLKAFISYSHLDEPALERLKKHMAMLKRDGSIVEWFDQKIMPGGDIDAEISAHLQECELFIPLVTADFLDSKYCYERELARALARHEEGTMRVLPVIVQACDWKASPLGKIKALPKDGKPIADWTNENNAWLDVISQLRRVIEEVFAAPSKLRDNTSTAKSPLTPKYRLKRDFDEVDKLEFRENAFLVFKNYFEQAAAEIGGIENIKSRFSVIGDTGFSCTVVNRARNRGVAHVTVYASAGRSLGDITYSFQEHAEPNTANGWFQIEADEYELFLEQNAMMRGDDKLKLSPSQAAAQLWEEFLEQAGITNE